MRDAYYICPKCGGYFKVRAYERIRRVADEGTFQESDRELVGENPLGFEGYEEKLAAERLKTRMKEAIVTGNRFHRWYIGSDWRNGQPFHDGKHGMGCRGKADSSDRESNDGKLTVNSVYLLRRCAYAGRDSFFNADGKGICCNGKAPRGRAFVCLCIDRSDYWRCDS